MLSSFIKKKKKEGTLKTFNIESIQSAIEEATEPGAGGLFCTAASSQEKISDIVNKEENFSSPHKKPKIHPVDEITNKQLLGRNMKRDKKKGSVKCLEDYNIVSDTSFTVDNKEILSQPEDKPTSVGGSRTSFRHPFLNSTRSHEYKGNTVSTTDCHPGDDDIETRKLRVMSHATKNIEVKYSRVNSALYLPKNFKMISSLYTIIYTIYDFNRKRDLSLIFIKYRDSIERLFKHRVEMAMLEQLNYIANGAIKFIPIEVLEEGVRTATFKIDIVQSIDIDFSLFNYLCETYKTWLVNNGSVGATNKMHPDFLADEVCIPTKPFLPSLVVSSRDELLIKRIAREKTGSILDRIKEKERMRREEFIKEQAVDRDYEGRLASLFDIGNKRAVKMSDVLFKMGGFDCRAQILKILGERYIIREINGEEYIVKK